MARRTGYAVFSQLQRSRRGGIGLQDHGDQAAFRNIKIRDIRN